MQSKSFVFYILIFIVLIWYNCFGYVGLKSYANIFTGAGYITTGYLIVTSASSISFNKYKLPTLILISTILSMFMSIILWHQGLFDIVKGFYFYYPILVFFLFMCKECRCTRSRKGVGDVSYYICVLLDISDIESS